MVASSQLFAEPTFLFAFVFSSRRRHTSLQGDWSSDVCSSDLQARGPDRDPLPHPGGGGGLRERVGRPAGVRPSPQRALRAGGPRGFPDLRQLPTTSAGRGARGRTFRAAAPVQGGTLPCAVAVGAWSGFRPTLTRGADRRLGMSEEAAP